jgi:hypothetical protein
MKRTFMCLLTAISLFVAACNSNSGGPHTGGYGSIPDSVKVPVEVAKQYVSNYALHAGYVDSAAGGKELAKPGRPDTRCIWFSKQRLAQLLQQLEKEDGDGVRFYIMTYNGAYTSADEKYRPVPPPPYWGYNSLLMVSTRDSTLKNGRVLHRDYYSDLNMRTTIAQKPGFIVGLVPENRGEICPPPSRCDSTGALLLTN